jgi:ribose-phosphate pyrophosphokinase
MHDKLRLISGNSNVELAESIASCLGNPLTDTEVSRFSDGEIVIKINQNIRGADVFIIQSTHPPAENLLELLILTDAARRASAKTVTAVIPYFGYARQDRKDQPRVPITAKLVANLITTAGADRVLTVDLHAGQIQGFFDIPVDHLYASPILLDHFKEEVHGDIVMISPDVGSIKTARSCAKRLECSLALVDKRRPAPNQLEVMHVIGDVKGKQAIIIDDMVDTGGTLTEAARAVMKHGAEAVYAGCTHPVLSGDAVGKINSSSLKELVVTDTIPVPESKRNGKVKIKTTAGLLADAIERIHEEKSVSVLFET